MNYEFRHMGRWLAYHDPVSTDSINEEYRDGKRIGWVWVGWTNSRARNRGARGLGTATRWGARSGGGGCGAGLRDAGDGAELAARISGMGRRVMRVQMDVARLDQIDAAVTRWRRRRSPKLIFDLTLAVNLKGTFFVSQAAGKIMIRQKFGRIINLSSQAGFVALADGVDLLHDESGDRASHQMRTWPWNGRRTGITVNAVAPTFIRTPGTEKWLNDPAFKAELLRKIPLGRVGEPTDVAGAVVFLASPAASLITGTTLMIDGGWTAV